MKLNVYESRRIIKTYEAESYDLMFGTVEDILTLFNVDDLKTGSDVEIIKMVGKVLPQCIDTVKPLLKDIFEGITDEELKKTKMKEIVVVLIDVIKYSFSQMNIGLNSKN